MTTTMLKMTGKTKMISIAETVGDTKCLLFLTVVVHLALNIAAPRVFCVTHPIIETLL